MRESQCHTPGNWEECGGYNTQISKWHFSSDGWLAGRVWWTFFEETTKHGFEKPNYGTNGTPRLAWQIQDKRPPNKIPHWQHARQTKSLWLDSHLQCKWKSHKDWHQLCPSHNHYCFRPSSGLCWTQCHTKMEPIRYKTLHQVSLWKNFKHQGQAHNFGRWNKRLPFWWLAVRNAADQGIPWAFWQDMVQGNSWWTMHKQAFDGTGKNWIFKVHTHSTCKRVQLWPSGRWTPPKMKRSLR